MRRRSATAVAIPQQLSRYGEAPSCAMQAIAAHLAVPRPSRNRDFGRDSRRQGCATGPSSVLMKPWKNLEWTAQLVTAGTGVLLKVGQFNARCVLGGSPICLSALPTCSGRLSYVRCSVLDTVGILPVHLTWSGTDAGGVQPTPWIKVYPGKIAAGGGSQSRRNTLLKRRLAHVPILTKDTCVSCPCTLVIPIVFRQAVLIIKTMGHYIGTKDRCLCSPFRHC